MENNRQMELYYPGCMENNQKNGAVLPCVYVN